MPDKSAVIFGVEGCILKNEERAFFNDINPLGYILFSRNIEKPDQLRALCNSLRAISGNRDTPILIDQEGGRVQRMQSPFWRDAPCANAFGDLWDKSPESARRAVALNTMLFADELNNVGIDVDCAPLLDTPIPEVTKVIGDRAFHTNPAVIVELARIQADNFLAHGILPVIKHIPGHGRATSDSHLDLPIVDADEMTLEKSDFVPFKALNSYPLGMTAHIIYSTYDSKFPATISSTMIQNVIRDKLGFEGLLLSDDLSMKALSGPFELRAKKCLDAGCDIVLHCNGDMNEMHEVTNGLTSMTNAAKRRWENALKARQATKKIDVADSLDELNQLFALS